MSTIESNMTERKFECVEADIDPYNSSVKFYNVNSTLQLSHFDKSCGKFLLLFAKYLDIVGVALQR